ncbi:MAG: MBL fold metallo-hydrolase [Phycisphaerae bacterium]
MQNLLPNLWHFTSTLTGTQHPVNSYVVLTPYGPVLIDPAADLTPAALSAIPEINPADIKHILITHLHAENAAGCANFPAALVHLPPGDEFLATGRAAYEALDLTWFAPWDWGSRGNFRGHVAGARNERPTEQPLRLGEPLHPAYNMLGFTTLATPGHGKSAVTLITQLGDKTVAFSGDLVYAGGRLWNWFDCDWDYGPQTGQLALLASATRLAQEKLDLLCPTHGPIITDPAPTLQKLCDRLQKILHPTPSTLNTDRFVAPVTPGPTPDFIQVSPHLLVWCNIWGNCAVVLSDSGNALMIDDGLCQWIPHKQRTARHRQAMTDLKKACGIKHIELVIPTHYHGDHTENIPELVALEAETGGSGGGNTQVVCLATVAEPIEHPERFNLGCPLPWYGCVHNTVRIDRKLAADTTFPWREYQVEIFHLGGQTFYTNGIQITIDGRRTIFVGDSLGGPSPECEPILTYNDADPATRGWTYALDILLPRRPDTLVCGHGPVLTDPHDLLVYKRASWDKRLADFAALSAQTPLRRFFDPFFS